MTISPIAKERSHIHLDMERSQNGIVGKKYIWRCVCAGICVQFVIESAGFGTEKDSW
jgi:hypothetical protein